MCIVTKMGSTSEARMVRHPNVTILATDIRTFLSDVRIFMIMASSCRQSREKVLVETPEWKRGNIGYIDHTDPVTMKHGRQYYLIHWENTSYDPSYIDSRYVKKMEDISKTKRTWYSPNEGWISPEQCVSLQGLWKDRALGRRLFEELSSRRQRIVEGETLELSIDPFADKLPEETGQKQSAKAPPQHEVPAEETGQKRSDKPPPRQSQQAGEKRSTKRPPQEGVRLEAVEKSSRKKSLILQETSTLAGEQSSMKRPPQGEGVRLEAMEKSSRKGPPDERLKEADKLKEAEERLRKQPVLVLQAAEKSSRKGPPDERLKEADELKEAEERLRKQPALVLQAAEKSSRKGPPDERLKEADKLKEAEERLRKQPVLVLQAAEKSSRKGLPDERLKEADELKETEERLRKQPALVLQAAEKSSRKGPPDERLKEADKLKEAEERLRKQPALVLQAAQKSSSQVQETSKQSSRRRRFITEEDDEMFSCNVDPFSAELVDRFEAHVENEAVESEQSLQENCF